MGIGISLRDKRLVTLRYLATLSADIVMTHSVMTMSAYKRKEALQRSLRNVFFCKKLCACRVTIR